jgi:hypothetical protein
MVWIDVAQDRDQWRALVNMVWTFGFHKMLGSSWIAIQLAAFQDGLSSMKLVLYVLYILELLTCFQHEKTSKLWRPTTGLRWRNYLHVLTSCWIVRRGWNYD